MPGKRIEIDDETWPALRLLAQDRMMTFQELADEAFADLLKKHGRPVDLRAALLREFEAQGSAGAAVGFVRRVTRKAPHRPRPAQAECDGRRTADRDRPRRGDIAARFRSTRGRVQAAVVRAGMQRRRRSSPSFRSDSSDRSAPDKQRAQKGFAILGIESLGGGKLPGAVGPAGERRAAQILPDFV